MAAFAALTVTLTFGAGSGTIEAFGYRWTVQAPADWVVAQEGGQTILRLVEKGEPEPGKPRRPTKFAIAETPMFDHVTVECEMRRAGRSLIIVYAWQDNDHWNYAHISSDEARKVNVHNGMFHVFGGERVRISSLDGAASLAQHEQGKGWAKVKFVFDGATGRAYAEVDGKRNESLEAVDLSLRFGRVGLGSFNETGDFRNVRITGTPRKP